jgi:putative phosphoesterase
MSDSHDNIWNLRRALSMIRVERADLIIHCGDFVAPFMLKELEKAEIPVFGVLGNNDGSGFLLAKTAFSELRNITLFEVVGEIERDGFSIAFTHLRAVAEGLAATKRHNLVCYGHSHQYHLENTGHTLLLNPGEIMGKEGNPCFCILDSSTRAVVRHEIVVDHH